MEKKNFKLKLLLLILIMMTIVTSVTYAAFIVLKRQSVDNTVSASCFSTSFTEGLSIRINNALPMDDSDGLETIPYTFRVTNTCNLTSKYYIVLSTKGTMDDYTLRYSLNGSTPKYIVDNDENSSYNSQLFDNSYILSTGVLANGEYFDGSLKIWLSSDVLYDSSKSSWQGEVRIISVVKEFDDNDNGKDSDDNGNGSSTESYIKCLNNSGEVMDCPDVSNLQTGQRIAIGNQVFRYIRTTDENSLSPLLNECSNGSTASIACQDVTSGKLRLLAEYNLLVGSYCTSTTCTEMNQTDLAAGAYGNGLVNETIGLQSEYAIAFRGDNVFPRYGCTPYSTSSVKGTYSTSYTGSLMESYVNEYVSTLNSLYFDNERIVAGSGITKAELEYLGCNSSTSTCTSSSYPWLYSTTYWSMSPNDSSLIWRVNTTGSYVTRNAMTNTNILGTRPVIEISSSLLN